MSVVGTSTRRHGWCPRTGFVVVLLLLALGLAVVAETAWLFVDSLDEGDVSMEPAGWAALAVPVAVLVALGIFGARAWRRHRDWPAIALLGCAFVASLFLAVFLVFLAAPLGI
jgi:hypothetical protein